MVNSVNSSRTMSMRWAFLLVSIVLPACGQSDADVANGDDPMKALAAPYLSTRYNATYWNQTSVTDRDLWARAVRFCEGIEDPRQYPNCKVVRSVAALDQMARPREDKPDTFNLMMEPMAPDTLDSR